MGIMGHRLQSLLMTPGPEMFLDPKVVEASYSQGQKDELG